MSIGYRLAEPADMGFVVDSWVESYRDSHSAGITHMDRWREVVTPDVTRILSRPGCKVWVAHWLGDTDRVNDLKGWIAVERGYQVKVKVRESGRWVKKLVTDPAPLIHYAYVRDGWRRSDGHLPAISIGLLEAAGVSLVAPFRYTCRTAVCSRLDLRSGVWSPLIARFDPPAPQV